MADEPVKVVFVDLTEGRECVINRLVHGNFFGSMHVLTLGTNRAGVGPNGELQEQCAIIARLRLDTEMATVLRDALNMGLAAVSPPANEKPN